MFDLYNEPHPDTVMNTSEAWMCWRDGGYCPGIGWKTAGMQTLVDAIRYTGAENILLLVFTEFSVITIYFILPGPDYLEQ